MRPRWLFIVRLFIGGILTAAVASSSFAVHFPRPLRLGRDLPGPGDKPFTVPINMAWQGEPGYWWVPDPSDGGWFLWQNGSYRGYIVPTPTGFWQWVGWNRAEPGCEYPAWPCSCISWPAVRVPIQVPKKGK